MIVLMCRNIKNEKEFSIQSMQFQQLFVNVLMATMINKTKILRTMQQNYCRIRSPIIKNDRNTCMFYVIIDCWDEGLLFHRHRKDSCILLFGLHICHHYYEIQHLIMFILSNNIVFLTLQNSLYFFAIIDCLCRPALCISFLATINSCK